MGVMSLFLTLCLWTLALCGGAAILVVARVWHRARQERRLVVERLIAASRMHSTWIETEPRGRG